MAGFGAIAARPLFGAAVLPLDGRRWVVCGQAAFRSHLWFPA